VLTARWVLVAGAIRGIGATLARAVRRARVPTPCSRRGGELLTVAAQVADELGVDTDSRARAIHTGSPWQSPAADHAVMSASRVELM